MKLYQEWGEGEVEVVVVSLGRIACGVRVKLHPPVFLDKWLVHKRAGGKQTGKVQCERMFDSHK